MSQKKVLDWIYSKNKRRYEDVCKTKKYLYLYTHHLTQKLALRVLEKRKLQKRVFENISFFLHFSKDKVDIDLDLNFHISK